MTPCKPGDVVLLPFPFTDLSTAKQRPAVVISTDAYNAGQRDCIVLAITSNLQAGSPGDCRLADDEQRLAGLPKPSLVKCGKIVTIDQRLIRKVVGRLPASTVQRLKQYLLATLA